MGPQDDCMNSLQNYSLHHEPESKDAFEESRRSFEESKHS